MEGEGQRRVPPPRAAKRGRRRGRAIAGSAGLIRRLSSEPRDNGPPVLAGANKWPSGGLLARAPPRSCAGQSRARAEASPSASAVIIPLKPAHPRDKLARHTGVGALLRARGDTQGPNGAAGGSEGRRGGLRAPAPCRAAARKPISEAAEMTQHSNGLFVLAAQVVATFLRLGRRRRWRQRAPTNAGGGDTGEALVGGLIWALARQIGNYAQMHGAPL